MLTVKIITLDGLENIAETSKAQYSPLYNYISLDEGGMEIPPGATAYIMNGEGRTISKCINNCEPQCGPQQVPVTSDSFTSLISRFSNNGWTPVVKDRDEQMRGKRTLTVGGIVFFEDNDKAKKSGIMVTEFLDAHGELSLRVG